MADNVITNLSIEVTASADKAASVFDRLASSAGRLRGAAQGAAGGMQDMAQGARDAETATETAGERARQAQPKIRGVGKDAKDAGDKARKGASGLATFWQSLKRIAFYRFVRTVLKEITSAFKEGITNLYHWSAAVNGTFAKSMDRIASSTLYLKNSLGAMLAPLINTLAPVIEWIIDRIVDVINWINKLFAALSGSQTYVVAKKVATTWGDAGKDAAGSAKKAADDIKRTILGFDEINKLEKQNTSSGSGGIGSTTSGPSYKDMFEERKLDGWMSKLASFIDKFNLQIPALFGGLLAGWAAVKLAIEGVAKLSLGWLKDMAGKVIEVGVSLFRKGWTTIKNWALSFGEAVVDLAVRVKTKIVDLWASIVTAWNALSPVLQAGIAITVTAAALWAAYKLAWALVPDKMLQVEVAIKTAAITLKNGLVKAWNNLAVWSLSVGVKIATTANALKEGLVKAWNNLAIWTLGVVARISTTAAQLKNDIVRAWNKLTDWYLGVKLRIETKLADLFKWVKDNWKTVAAVALGVAIAIATPWSTIATALSSLWADVMASFGGALAFSVVPTLNPTDDYGLGWTPKEFYSKQEEIDTAAKELRGSSTSTALPKVDTSALTKGLLGAGGVAAVGALVSGLLSGGASTALASIFMPGVSSAADKSELSPKTSYYNQMTGELVIPKSVDVGVNYVANGDKKYKNSTLGNYLVDTMAKVKSTAQTKVSSIAGALMEVVNGKLTPTTTGTTTKNTVYALAGSGMENRNASGLAPVTLNTSTTNTVNALAGAGMKKAANNVLSAITSNTTTVNTINGNPGTLMGQIGNSVAANVSNTTSINTVNASAGYGMSGTNSYSLSAITSDTSSKNVVYALAGSGMADRNASGLAPVTLDTSTSNTVNATPGSGMTRNWNGSTSPIVEGVSAGAYIYATTQWGNAGRSLKDWVGGNDIDSTAYIDCNTQWGNYGRSLRDWIGENNLDATAYVDVDTQWGQHRSSLFDWLGLGNLRATAVVDVVKRVSQVFTGYRANGGIYSNGAWSDIPQYANGKAGVNHGSLFWAGENGAEIVGNAGGRTEVLNKSQIASAMYSAVQAAMAPAAANFASAAERMGVSEVGFDLETLVDMVRQGVEQAMSRSNDYDRQTVELLRSINDKDSTIEISTSSINKAQTRMNRRAGTTIVPVGT